MNGDDSQSLGRAHTSRELQRNGRDTVLARFGLPEMDGYEACRRIRETHWGRSIVVLALSGWGQQEDHRKSHEAGFDGHLLKPVDRARLVKWLGNGASP